MKAGNLETRTDRVAYMREGSASWSNYSANLVSCHRRLRSIAHALQPHLGGGSTLLVPRWTQLACYADSGGFYKWHSDGASYPAWYWLGGPLTLFLFLQIGAIRRRRVTSILYLNE